MIDLDRLSEGMVLTTERPVAQPQGGTRYPIYQVFQIDPEKREVIVKNTEAKGQELLMLTEEDLKGMFLVGVSLNYKDRFIRELLGKNRETGQGEGAARKLLFSICKASPPEVRSQLAAYLQEISEGNIEIEIDKKLADILQELGQAMEVDPELLKQVKIFFQETLESTARVQPGLMQYKQNWQEPRTQKKSTALDRKSVS